MNLTELFFIAQHCDYDNFIKAMADETGKNEKSLKKAKIDLTIPRKNNKVPEWSEVLELAISREPGIDQKALKNKYDSWVVNGWKDGYNKPIKNWKSKIINVLTYLPKKDVRTNYKI